MKTASCLCILLLVLTAGCIEVEETITLNSDGSGLLELSYGMKEEQIQKMEQAAAEAEKAQAAAKAEAAAEAGIDGEAEVESTEEPSASPLDFDEETIRQQFKEVEVDGVKLESVHTESREGMKFVQLKIRFPSLAGLVQTPLMSERHLSLAATAEGNYLFKLSAGEAEGQNLPEATDPDTERMLQSLMQGFRVVVNVRPPGKVLKSNASRQGEREATWEFDISKDPQAVSRVSRLDMWVTFDGQGLELKQFPGERTGAP